MGIQIRRVTIRNFRSIGETDVEFTPGMLCALIGENNSGKSNILRAIQRLLGPTWPQIQSFSEDDFYRRNRANDLYIELEILRGDFIEVVAFGRHPSDGQFRLVIDGNRYPSRDQRERYPFVLIDVNREVREQMAYDRWTPLGRLLQDINREFQADAERSAAFSAQMNLVKGLLGSSDRFRRLTQIVLVETARLLGRDPEDFRVDFQFYDPWNFYRTFQIIATDDQMDLQANQMGMGLQSALTVAILRAYSEVRHSEAILAIEEPEVYLNPQAQRNFYSILRQLADSGVQVFYTTHSPCFVDVAHFDEICLVRREGDAGQKATTVTQLDVGAFLHDFVVRHPDRADDATEDGTRQHLAKRYGTEQNEGFFASKVVLVEGDSERRALRVYAKALDCDFDRHGIAVVSAEGKDAMPDLFRLFNEFRIPCFIVFDGDRSTPDGQADINQELLTMAGAVPHAEPETAVGERHAVFECDFETTMAQEIPDYGDLEEAANRRFGLHPERHKPIRAEFIAEELVRRGTEEDPGRHVPSVCRDIIERIRALTWHGSVLLTRP